MVSGTLAPLCLLGDKYLMRGRSPTEVSYRKQGVFIMGQEVLAGVSEPGCLGQGARAWEPGSGGQG